MEETGAGGAGGVTLKGAQEEPLMPMKPRSLAQAKTAVGEAARGLAEAEARRRAAYDCWWAARRAALTPDLAAWRAGNPLGTDATAAEAARDAALADLLRARTEADAALIELVAADATFLTMWRARAAAEGKRAPTAARG